MYEGDSKGFSPKKRNKAFLVSHYLVFQILSIIVFAAGKQISHSILDTRDTTLDFPNEPAE